jgi:hypothetical protein
MCVCTDVCTYVFVYVRSQHDAAVCAFGCRLHIFVRLCTDVCVLVCVATAGRPAKAKSSRPAERALALAPDGRLLIAEDDDDVTAKAKQQAQQQRKKQQQTQSRTEDEDEAMDVDAMVDEGARTYSFRGANWDRAEAAGRTSKKTKPLRNVQWVDGHGGGDDEDDDDDDDGDAVQDRRGGGAGSDARSVGSRGSRGTARSRGAQSSRGSGRPGPPRRTVAGVETGDRFRARKAHGDVRRAGQLDPYAYLPLAATAQTARKRAKVAGKEHNVVRAAQRGSRAGRSAAGKHGGRRGRGARR